jgi:hypothetical protein
VPANGVSVHLRYAYRVGSEGDAQVPTTGLSIGGGFEHRLLGFRSGIEIGAGVDFFYDRFSKDVAVSSIDPASGNQQLSITTQTLSQTSFALTETTAWRYADLRVFGAAGAGFTVGYFTGVAPTGNTASTNDVQPLARGALGVDFAIASKTAAVLRVDYTHTFKRNDYFVSPTGALHPMFGDLFDVGIGLLVRF